MIPPINGKFKLNLDEIERRNRSTLEWVTRDSNKLIIMSTCRYLGNPSINIVECRALSNDV